MLGIRLRHQCATAEQVEELRHMLIGVRASQARLLKLARQNDIAMTDLDNRVADVQEHLDDR